MGSGLENITRREFLRVSSGCLVALAIPSLGSENGDIISTNTIRKKNVNAKNYPLLYVNDGYACVNTKDANEEVPLFDGDNPKWSPNGKEVLYEGEKGIWLYNLIDGSKTRLTSEGTDPVWEPNGNRFLYKDGDDLILLDIKSGLQKKLVQGSDPQWIDSDSFLFKDGNTINLANILPLLNNSQTNNLELVLNGVGNAVLSHDKKMIAYTETSGPFGGDSYAILTPLNKIGEVIGASALLVCDIKGRNKQKLYSVDVIAGHSRFFSSVSWSPDGKKIAFTSDRGVGRKSLVGDTIMPIFYSDVMVYDLTTKNVTKVFSDLSDVLSIDWCPDSQAFIVSRMEEIRYKGMYNGGIVEVIVGVRALRPDFLDTDRTGLDPKLLDNDQLIEYHLRTGSRTLFSGHFLDVYFGK